MENHIGLAFTSDAITIAHFKKSPDEKILNSLDRISYPFPYDESIFFLEENIVRLANHILNHLESIQIQPTSVSVSIESNLCLAKRIKIPLNYKDKEEANHIHWDLENSIITSLDDYVYLKTDSIYNHDNFKEVLVIALRKNIVEFFQSLVDFAKMKIMNLSANQLAAEICFKNALKDKTDNISLLYRISQDRLESICLHNGNLYMSNYEKIKLVSSRSPNEILLEKITNYIKFVENYFDHAQESSSKIDQIYIYGLEIKEDLKSLLDKNISTPISTLNPLNNLNLSPELNNLLENSNNLSGFVECIGVALDAD